MLGRTSVPLLVSLILGLGALFHGPVVQAVETAPDAGRAPSRVIAPQRTAPGAAPSATNAGKVIKLEKGMRKNLTRMPDTQRIQVGGKEMTLGELRKQSEADQKKAVAKIKGMTNGNLPGVESLQADFDKAEAARINAANAKVATEMAKLKVAPAAASVAPAGAAPNAAQANAIRREAAEIQSRAQSGNATPQDEARAEELSNQFQQLK